MFIEADADVRRLLECVRIQVAAPLYAYFLPLGAFPLDGPLRAQLQEAMADMVEVLRQAKGLQRWVWLLLDELHREDAVTEIGRNAAIWQPEMGMGLRPETPSPKYWTGDDLLDRDYTTEMPVLKHTVVGLETNEAGANLACRSMTGRGALIQVLSSTMQAELTTRWHGVLQPTITEEGLAAYPLYVPLFGLASLAGQSAEMLDQWMGPAEVYVRESAEDKGVVILSRISLEEYLRTNRLLWAERPVPVQ